MKRVYIVGGDYGVRLMFQNTEGWEISQSLEDADLIQYCGGADVSPFLYGEKNTGLSYCSPKRDEQEVAIFKRALELGKPMAGICRGNQFLAVMNGCKLHQDITKHAIGGTHPIIDVKTGVVIEASSTHHQSVKMPKNHHSFELVAVSYLGGVKRGPEGVVEEQEDVEGCWFPDTCCLSVQGHPEYQVPEFKEYYFSLLNRYLNL